MARIIMADDGIPFDGRTPETGPLGGAESAFVSLAEALARRGHAVTAYTLCTEPLDHKGVEWRPVRRGMPDQADLYIANRGHALIRQVARAKAAVFWIHNPAQYLLKWRYLWPLWRRRPPIVFSGAYHASTYPAWAPSGKRLIIPYAIHEPFRCASDPAVPPRPRAVFTSNPLRSLDWLISLWVTRVHAAVPQAELHIFSGPATYGTAGAAKANAMAPVLAQAQAMAECGIVVREPIPRDRLAYELAGFRVFVYRGSEDESFCMAAGEAQAAGVPAVVCDIGCLAERVRHLDSGFVVTPEEGRDERDFASATIKILTDDALWKRLHAGALAHQRGRSWDDAASEFERLIP